MKIDLRYATHGIRNTKELLGEPKTIAVFNDAHILHGVTDTIAAEFDGELGMTDDCYSKFTIYGKCAELVNGMRRQTSRKVVVKFINEFGMLTSSAMETVIRNYDEYIKERNENTQGKLIHSLNLYVKQMLMYDLRNIGIESFYVYDVKFE